MAPSKSVSEKYVLKTCMRGVWMVWLGIYASYILLHQRPNLLMILCPEQFHSLKSFFFSTPVYLFPPPPPPWVWLAASSTLPWLCLCSSFHPSSIWLILPHLSGSSAPSCLPQNPSLCCGSILSIIPLWHLTLALPIQLAKWLILHLTQKQVLYVRYIFI